MEWLETHPPQVQLPIPEAEMSTSPLWKAEGKLSGFVFPQLFPVLKGYWLQPCPLKETGNNLSLFCFYLTKNLLTGKFSLKAACVSGREVVRHIVLLLHGQRWKDILLSELFQSCFLPAAGPWNRRPQVWISKVSKNPTHFPQAKALHSQKCSLSLLAVTLTKIPDHFIKSIFSWNWELYW